MKNVRKTLLIAIGAAALAMTFTAPARAADVSAWAQDSYSAFRLIAGSNKAGATPLRAGIEIKMGPGWHTYWRYPGDSGVPPRFDFSGSENLKRAEVRYPAPYLYTDETGNTLGYKNGVTFPLDVTPQDKSKPVDLHLKLNYAVCAKLCVPAQGSAQLTLVPGTSAQNATLAAAEARVPKPVTAAQAGLTVKRVKDGAKPLVMVDLKAPADEKIQVFVEGPTPEWALPIPKPAPGAPAGHREFAFALDGLPPGVSPKGAVELTFTIVEGVRPIQVTTRLD
ncbi:MAG: protein-disulfide reductase DsbD family protein [Pseudolabrys sp.]